jgi:hypothetical protein
MFRTLCISGLSLAALLASQSGCEDSSYDANPSTTSSVPTTGTTSNESMNTPTEVDINVDTDRAGVDNRAERRENLRNAIEGVDVNVRDGQVDVDVQRE